MDKELTHSHDSGRKFTVTVSSPGQCSRVLSLEIPQEEVEHERELIARQMRRELRIPGFRRGKVPLEFIQKNYGEVIKGDAVRNLLPIVYEQALIQEQINPIAEPSFNNLKAEEGEGIRVEASVEVRPDVEVKDYRGVAVVAARNEVGDQEVKRAVDSLRERMATYESVEREAASSDFVIIDYVPYLESGEKDEKARQTNHPADLSSGQLLEEFRVGLVGMKSGESKDIEVFYPDDFAEKELAGTSKKFSVTVNEVKEKLLPDADDAFASQVSGQEITSMAQLETRIREDLVEEEEKRYKHELGEKIIDELLKTNEFEVPTIMVENYLHSLIEEDRRRRPQVPDEAKREEEIGHLFRDAAERTIKKYFILEALQRQEGLAVSEDDIEDRVKALAESTGKDVEEIRGFINRPDQRRTLERDLLDEKALNFLRENADIKAA